MIVRPSEASDADALAAIYGHDVLHGFGTFEEVPPSPLEMAQRRLAIVERGLPHVVAEEDGKVLGFAYAGLFRPRAAYRFTVEDSVYVAPEAHGQGVGKAMLSEVLAACEALGLRQVMAVIGDSGNAGSIGLHTSLGFRHAGICQSVGFKHGRWVDTVWMQKALNGGDASAPAADGLILTGH
ncbi:MAG: N-acetyltransferase family protein [Phenylobacterium sp.]|uniref:GNAT family N-acetyltransferase n=1 Tax=Phenylobacterium sp. TaxID=1871053 RepID=UPI003BB6E1A3